MELRVLVAGSVDGQFERFYEKINKVCARAGPFDMLLVVGNFFSDDPSFNEIWNDPIKRQNLKLPTIPTYILGPLTDIQLSSFVKSGEQNIEFGFELGDEVTYLGKKGVLTGSSGIKIAYLSGQEAIPDDKHISVTKFTETEVNDLITQVKSSPIDILLTSQSPRGFSNCLGILPSQIQQISDKGSALISSLALSCKPRYHFTSSNQFFERHPYRNHVVLKEKTKAVTRFICLGPCNESSKPKYLYAFTIVPSCLSDKQSLIQQPGDVTECPYKFVEEAKVPVPPKINRIFYSEEEIEEEPKERKKKHIEKRDVTEDCWFCLSSPKVEKNLIISIGDHWYLAGDKGPLVSEHLLLLPIGHHRSIAEISNDEETMKEMDKFIEALEKYFNSKGEVGVYIERNFRSFHLQLHIIPIPRYKAKTCCERAMEISAANGLQMESIEYEKNFDEFTKVGVPYFLMKIPSTSFKGFIRINVKQAAFPLQLHRMIAADSKVLNLPHKIDWKKCILESEEAVEHTKIVRENFKPYDFTLL